MIRATIVAFVAVLAPLMLAQPSVASHYRLPADGLVDASEHSALTKAGVATTQQFFQRTAKLADRKALASATGIAPARLDELAHLVDLMRVRGIGPSMAKLLTAAGVPHTRALRALTGEGLALTLEETNRAHGVTPVVPSAETVADWIDQSRKLAQVLEVAD